MGVEMGRERVGGRERGREREVYCFAATYATSDVFRYMGEIAG